MAMRRYMYFSIPFTDSSCKCKHLFFFFSPPFPFQVTAPWAIPATCIVSHIYGRMWFPKPTRTPGTACRPPASARSCQFTEPHSKGSYLCPTVLPFSKSSSQLRNSISPGGYTGEPIHLFCLWVGDFIMGTCHHHSLLWSSYVLLYPSSHREAFIRSEEQKKGLFFF